MGVNDITLTGGMRAALASLQLTSILQGRTTERLSTGLRVNSAVDDAAAFFSAQTHRGRANDLAARKDAMGEAIQTVKAADAGITAITKLIEQAKGLASQAKSATAADRATLATQFGDLLTQIDNLSADSGYKGTNLLAGDTLTVDLNEDASSQVDIVGFDATAAGDLAIAAAANAWVANTDVDAAVTDLDAALGVLRTNSKTLSANVGIVSSRQDFTNSLISTLTDGADNLTLADTNQESANMVALQTRQQLGVAAMSLTNQIQQSILRLF